MIGRKLNNRYEVIELIGEGATATVYRGVDTRLQRSVAIKVLLPYVDSTTRQRFQREALSAARLNHPNIMGIYDVEEEEQPYLIVEYVQGRPLSSFIPASPQVVVEFGRQICQALDYAHRQNIIHRDIKPANIQITPGGQVKIMDFGLAIARSGAAKRLTATGRIIGTPAYLSPEQAQGLPLTHRTDIYSTGVVLYELITGALPFDSDDIGVLLLQQVKKDPKPPSELVSEIPLALERIILKALAKNPDARFETAGAMATALGASIATGAETISADAVSIHATLDTGVVRAEEESPTAEESSLLRVALADDHRILRTSLAMYLDEAEGIEVVGEADNGEQALTLVEQQHPDVLLLDLNMPGSSGLDVLPQIRTAWPDVRVLVLTGRDEDVYIMRALQAGAHGYVLKTINEEDLLRAVHDVAEGHLVLGRGVAERVVQGLMSRDSGPSEHLGELERAILTGVAAGLTNDDIAARLHIDPQLVAESLAQLIDQLGASSRTEASLIALREGWILLEDLHNF